MQVKAVGPSSFLILLICDHIGLSVGLLYNPNNPKVIYLAVAFEENFGFDLAHTFVIQMDQIPLLLIPSFLLQLHLY